MATATATIIKRSKGIGGLRSHICDLSLDGTYATGGVDIDPDIFGLSQVNGIVTMDENINAEDILYVRSTGKMLVLNTTSHTHVFTGSQLGTHQHAAITAGTPAGTVAAPVFSGAELATHQHAVITAGTPAGTVAAPVFSGAEMATHQHAAITAGTPSGTLVPKYEVIDLSGITKPAIALTHNADPPTNLLAQALYIIEDQGQASANVGRLESTTNANASVSGETADGAVYGTAASCRFFVLDTDTPGGVQIYVNEGESDRLEFVSPTEADAYIVMPFETVAVAPPGAAIAVKVTHSATAANGKPLYFDDNGAANAQLCFVDTGTTGGTVPAGDITILRPVGVTDAAANLGAFTGAEMGTHQHAAITAGTPAGTNDAPTFTGSEMGTHQHAAVTAGTPAGTNDAPTFTGSQLGTHQHAAITAGTPAGTNAALTTSSMEFTNEASLAGPLTFRVVAIGV